MSLKSRLFLLSLLFVFVGCTRRTMHVTSVETSLLAVDSSLNAVQDTGYLAMLAPVSEGLEEQLNIPLGYTDVDMVSRKPESTLLNWASDALFMMAKQVYTGEVDLAVVNAGGLRCEWQKGPLTFRNVFELMPFDNELVILTLKGENIIRLAQNCVEQNGQGVSASFRVKGENGQLISCTVHGKEVNPEALYYVATSDYLSGGADGLDALPLFEDRVFTGRKIRDLYIECIRQQGTITASVDGRMTIN